MCLGATKNIGLKWINKSTCVIKSAEKIELIITIFLNSICLNCKEVLVCIGTIKNPGKIHTRF